VPVSILRAVIWPDRRALKARPPRTIRDLLDGWPRQDAVSAMTSPDVSSMRDVADRLGVSVRQAVNIRRQIIDDAREVFGKRGAEELVSLLSPPVRPTRDEAARRKRMAKKRLCDRPVRERRQPVWVHPISILVRKDRAAPRAARFVRDPFGDHSIRR
jgi:hypothetical protein